MHGLPPTSSTDRPNMRGQCTTSVGQTYSFARHFLHTCRRILGYETLPDLVIAQDRSVAVVVIPIGIDVEGTNVRRYGLSLTRLPFRVRAINHDPHPRPPGRRPGFLCPVGCRASDEVQAAMRELQSKYGTMRILFGRDKLDTIKGIPQKLRAFERFLQTYPEWQGKVRPSFACQRARGAQNATMLHDRASSGSFWARSTAYKHA